MSNPKPEPYTEREWRERSLCPEDPNDFLRRVATIDHLFARVAELEEANADLADLAESYLAAMCSDRCDYGDDCERERAEIRKLRG